jgi:hypothetical protein
VPVVPLIRVEPVVAPVGSWIAAHGAWCATDALARGRIGFCPVDPNPDHDRQCDDVKQRDENRYSGQIAVHLLSLPPDKNRVSDDFVLSRGATCVTGSGSGERQDQMAADGVTGDTTAGHGKRAAYE